MHTMISIIVTCPCSFVSNGLIVDDNQYILCYNGYDMTFSVSDRMLPLALMYSLHSGFIQLLKPLVFYSGLLFVGLDLHSRNVEVGIKNCSWTCFEHYSHQFILGIINVQGMIEVL